MHEKGGSMEVCPKNREIRCPLYNDGACDNPEEKCIVCKIYEGMCSGNADIAEMHKRLDTLLKASQKVFRQFGITFEV
jgi:hypothetical protein